MLGDFPSWVDVDFLKNTATVLIVAAAIVGLICVIMIRSLAARLIVLVLLGAGAFGLYHYRDSISNCDTTCTCELFGESIQGDNCSASG